MTGPDDPIRIAVKRDGPRGWHYISRAHYDPKVHELADPEHRHPLDHDGDGRPGGSLPKTGETPAEAEAQPVAKPAPPPKPKRSRKVVR